MPNSKPIGVAYEDQYLDGATIANLQTRVAQLESRLQALGLIA